MIATPTLKVIIHLAVSALHARSVQLVENALRAMIVRIVMNKAPMLPMKHLVNRAIVMRQVSTVAKTANAPLVVIALVVYHALKQKRIPQ